MRSGQRRYRRLKRLGCVGVGAKVVGTACIIELTFLKGRDKLDVPFDALVAYDS